MVLSWCAPLYYNQILCLKNRNESSQHLASLHDIMNIIKLLFSQKRGGEVYGKVYGR